MVLRSGPCSRNSLQQISGRPEPWGLAGRADYKGFTVQWQALRIARPVALSRCQAQGI